MEAALSLIMQKDPAIRCFSEIEMYHWILEGEPNHAFAPIVSEVIWLPGTHLVEVIPAVPRSELMKELGKDQLFALNYREGSSLLVRFSPREYRGYVPESRIVQFQGAESELSQAIWALRGLPYLFSISSEDLLQSLSDKDSATGFTRSQNSEDGIIQRVLLPVQNALLTGEIHLTMLKKAEGCPSSVSYLPELGCWAISSRYDSVLVRTLEDLLSRTEGRWKTVSKFASYWLEQCAALSEEHLVRLQQSLTALTLVGEFCTDKSFILQTIQSGFFWYTAIKKNGGAETCVPTYETEAIFSSFPFLGRRCKQVSISTLEGVGATLTELVREVNSGDMNQTGREVMALFETEDRVVAAFQIKNLEYSLYLKLFDSLALALRQELPKSVPLMKLIREASTLCQKSALPAQIDFYDHLIRSAFQLLDTESDLYRSDFHSFLQVSLNSMKTTSDLVPMSPGALSIVLITPPLYFSLSELKHMHQSFGIVQPLAWEWRETTRDLRPSGVTLSCIHLIPRVSEAFDRSALLVFAGFSEEGRNLALQRLEDKRAGADCPGVFSYLKSADCDGKVSRLIIQGTNEAQHLQKLFPEHVFVFPNIGVEELIAHISPHIVLRPQIQDYQPDLPFQTRRTTVPECLILIVPLGIPGMGKSSLIPRIQTVARSLACALEVISSDAIRDQCMKSFMQKNKVFDAEKAFERTAKPSKEIFYTKLRELLQTRPARLIIYLDKNHPPNAVQPLLKELKTFRTPENLQLVALVPECQVPISIPRNSESVRFELSFPFLAQCLHRVTSRSGHETLTGTAEKRVSVTLMMFQMFRNFEFAGLLRIGFSHLLKIPFTNEGEDVPATLATLLYQVCIGSIPKDQLTSSIVSFLDTWSPSFPEVDNAPRLLSGLNALCNR